MRGAPPWFCCPAAPNTSRCQCLMSPCIRYVEAPGLGATNKESTRAIAPNRNVVPNPKGGWDVTGGGKGASAHTNTQSEAIDRAKEIVRNQGGGKVSISGRDGKIRAKDTVDPGNDPRSIPG